MEQFLELLESRKDASQRKKGLLTGTAISFCLIRDVNLSNAIYYYSLQPH